MASGPCADGQACNWDPKTYDAWPSEVLVLTGGWKLASFPDGSPRRWELSGKCPRCRCEDGISAMVPYETVSSDWAQVTVFLPGAEERAPNPVTITCSCSGTHPGRQSGVGCGQRAPITGPPQAD